MKAFIGIIILIATVLLNLANGANFEQEDVYDDYDVKVRSSSEPVEEDYAPPQYDLNDAPKLFQDFVNTFNKVYKTKEEYMQRYLYFVKNLKQIIEDNKDGRSVSSVNMFTDFSDDEIAKLGG